MNHELKIEESYYKAVVNGTKNFEIRYNDRGFQKGDTCILTCVYDGGNLVHSTKPKIKIEITYVSNYHQKENWCVFGFKII